jgi:hypothetical protein
MRYDASVRDLVRSEQLIDEVGEIRRSLDDVCEEMRAFTSELALEYPGFKNEIEAMLNVKLKAKVEPLYRRLDCSEAELNDHVVTLSDLLIDGKGP